MPGTCSTICRVASMPLRVGMLMSMRMRLGRSSAASVDGLVAVGRLTDQLEALGALEDGPRGEAEGQLIVHDQHGDHVGGNHHLVLIILGHRPCLQGGAR